MKARRTAGRAEHAAPMRHRLTASLPPRGGCGPARRRQEAWGWRGQRGTKVPLPRPSLPLPHRGAGWGPGDEALEDTLYRDTCLEEDTLGWGVLCSLDRSGGREGCCVAVANVFHRAHAVPTPRAG